MSTFFSLCYFEKKISTPLQVRDFRPDRINGYSFFVLYE